MKDWLALRSARERTMLLIGALLVLVTVFYLSIWQPLVGEHARLTEDVIKDREELAWMRIAAVEARKLTTRTTPSSDSRSLLARTTAELRNDKIATSRVQPEGDDRLRVRLEQVAFTRLLTVLDRLQSRYGIAVSESAIEPVSGSPGLVNVQLLLARDQG